MPTFLADLVPGEKEAGDGLGTIAEGEEEDYGHEANEELSQASEGNSQSQTSATRSRSASQAAMYEEGIEGDDDKDEEGDEDERDWDEGGVSQGVARDKASLSTMTAPVASGKGKKTWEQLQEEGEGEKAANVQVVVMLRKGGKTATTKGKKTWEQLQEEG